MSAWDRKAIDGKLVDWAAGRAAEYVDDAIGEDHGHRYGGAFFDGSAGDILLTGIRAAINAALERADVWACDRVAERTYSVHEVLEIVRAERPEWFEADDRSNGR